MIIQSNDEFLWVEKYRPRKVEDCVLPAHLKKTFLEFLENKTVPNLILSGGPGTGKTTVIRALLDELEADYYFINASSTNGIDMIRNDIPRYASSVSLTGGRKYVILDEGDNLSADAQKAFRGTIEEFPKCSFIVTCNYKNKLIEALRSRLVSIDFVISKTEVPILAGAFFKRACQILKNENVEFNKGTVAEVTKKYLPDWRRTLGELQKFSTSGKLDDDIVSKVSEESFQELIGHLKAKKYTETRKWVVDNLDNEMQGLFRKMYDQSHIFLKPATVPELVLILAEYQYKAGFCADQEINLLAMLTECMLRLEFNS